MSEPRPLSTDDVTEALAAAALSDAERATVAALRREIGPRARSPWMVSAGEVRALLGIVDRLAVCAAEARLAVGAMEARLAVSVELTDAERALLEDAGDSPVEIVAAARRIKADAYAAGGARMPTATGDDEVRCSCGHLIHQHDAFGCTAYVPPKIGGGGACCTRSASGVAHAYAAGLASRTPTATGDAERAAIERASRVFGWQHLARYSGQTDEWLDATLGAIVLAARTPTATGDAEEYHKVLQRVAAQHQRFLAGGGSCRCGQWPPPENDVEWPAHLAAEQTAALYGAGLTATGDAEVDREEFCETLGMELLGSMEQMGIEDADWSDGRALADTVYCLGYRLPTATGGDLRDRVEAEVYSENASAVLHGVTGTHPESYGGVTKDEALECAGDLIERIRAALAASSAPVVCGEAEEASGARCEKEPGHEGPHNGWAHYPGQLATWPHPAPVVSRPEAVVKAEARREDAEALRQAERDGYLFLDAGERVPWESIARWLDHRAASLAADPEADG